MTGANPQCLVRNLKQAKSSFSAPLFYIVVLSHLKHNKID